MSSFNCGECGKQCLDTVHGYITGCEHYPEDDDAIKHYVKIYLHTHASSLRYKNEDFVNDWKLGSQLYNDRKRSFEPKI